jgi:Tfp pilus assembly PilM family ATPase
MTTSLDKLFGTSLGMEFKEDALVITFVKNGISGIRLLSSAVFPLKTDDATLAEIRGYIHQRGEKPDKVFASIPDKWVITKFAEIPSIKGKGQEAVVNLMRFEIERHIPFNIEEVSFDFFVLDEKDEALSVAFVAVHREKMDYIADYLDKLSLRPDLVIPSSFAVLNTLELSGVTAGGLPAVMGIARKSKVTGQRGEMNIFLHFNSIHASMSVLKDGVYSYHRSFPYKIDEDPGPFVNDISRYLSEIQSKFPDERLNTLVLAGDLSSVHGIIPELKQKTAADIITLDQISDFTRDTQKGDINMLASSAGACFAGLGVATYTVNLLPHKMKFDSKKTVPMSTRIFLVLILVLVIGTFTVEAVKKKQYLAKIEAELKKNEPMIVSIEKLASDISSLQDKIDALRKLKNNEITLEVLSEISGLLPKDAWITNLEYRTFEAKDKKKAVGELVVSGFAASSAALVPILEDSPYFEKVAFVGPVKKTADKEQFKLSAQVVLPEKKKEVAGDEGKGQKEEKKEEIKNEKKNPGVQKNDLKGGPDNRIPGKASL